MNAKIRIGTFALASLVSIESFALTPSGKPYTDGGVTGNGGVSVVCRNANKKIKQARLLDLYEAEELGLELDKEDKMPTRLKIVRRNDLTEQEQVKQALYKLYSAKMENLAQVIESEMNAQADSKRWNMIPKSKGLPLSQDAYPSINDKECQFEQVALYRENGRIDVDTEINEEFSVTDRAATRVHEAIYKLAREQIEAKDSRATRRLVGTLFAKDSVSEMNLREFAYAAVGEDVANGTYHGKSVWVPEVKTVYVQNGQSGAATPSRSEVAAMDETKMGISARFMNIPAGTFTMGSPASEANRGGDETEHLVTLSPFEIQATEVTQKQWQLVMGNNPSNFKGENLPVEQVSWSDAKEFVNKLNALQSVYNYRLPTEAEWEYAARAGTKTPYAFDSRESDLGEYGWYDGNSGSTTHEVAKKKANAWGLYDMHGNVWEWVQDWYGNYSSKAETDPKGADLAQGATSRVIRGGGWYADAQGLRSAFRDVNPPGGHYFFLGLRLVRTKK